MVKQAMFRFINWVSRHFFASRLSYSHIESFIFNNSVKKIGNLILCHWEARRGITKVHSYPYLMILEVTNICNLACPFCLTGKGLSGGREKRHMSFDEAKWIIDEVADYVYMVQLYTWGEPLLNKDIVRIIEYAKKKHLYVMLSTNATALNDNNVKRMISCGIDYITLAIDGVTQDSYAIYRVGGDYEKVKSNVERLLRIRKEFSSRKPFIEWQFVVFRHNESEVDAAEQLAYSMGVDKFTPLPAYVEDKSWMPESSRYKTELYNPERVRHCERPWTHLNVRADMGIAPCCYEFFKSDDFGSALNHGFSDIWNNDKFQMSRRLLTQAANGEILESSKLICKPCIESGIRPSYVNLKQDNKLTQQVVRVDSIDDRRKMSSEE
jgi:MoaA/NifB/PqqE/SkfB family radical SAM enzyme